MLSEELKGFVLTKSLNFDRNILLEALNAICHEMSKAYVVHSDRVNKKGHGLGLKR